MILLQKIPTGYSGILLQFYDLVFTVQAIEKKQKERFLSIMERKRKKGRKTSGETLSETEQKTDSFRL